MAETVRTSVEDDIAVIMLCRPDVMNALNEAMRRDLIAALRDVDVRAVVITGNGRSSCSGQDLSEASTGLDTERVLAEEYVPLLRAIHESPAPVIAAVNGVAAGAGASLAIACNMVIAAESASFTMAFSRLGLLPDMGGT